MAPDCDLQTANGVIEHFKTKGYLKNTPGNRARGFALTGKHRMTFETSGPLYEQAMQEYFDPSLKIAHHVSFDPPHLCIEANMSQACRKSTTGTGRYSVHPSAKEAIEALDGQYNCRDAGHPTCSITKISLYTTGFDRQPSCAANFTYAQALIARCGGQRSRKEARSSAAW